MGETIKEFGRTVLQKMGLYDTLRRLAGHQLSHLNHERLEDRFTDIYRNKLWTHGNSDEPLSGTGSSLRATESLRSALENIFAKPEYTSILDVGCGDFTWMAHVNRHDLVYHGIDLVEDVIFDNRAKYGSDSSIFSLANAVTDELPAADIVIIREVLFHLSFEDIWLVLANVGKKSRKLILLTSDTSSKFNSDIESGDYRMLNLRSAPFNLPEPTLEIDETTSRDGRRMYGWTGAQLEGALAQAGHGVR